MWVFFLCCGRLVFLGFPNLIIDSVLFLTATAVRNTLKIVNLGTSWKYQDEWKKWNHICKWKNESRNSLGSGHWHFKRTLYAWQSLTRKKNARSLRTRSKFTLRIINALNSKLFLSQQVNTVYSSWETSISQCASFKTEHKEKLRVD